MSTENKKVNFELLGKNKYSTQNNDFVLPNISNQRDSEQKTPMSLGSEERKKKMSKFKQIDSESLLQKHNVHKNVARELLRSKPSYETASQSEKKSITDSYALNYKKLLKSSQGNEIKKELFKDKKTGLRDVASEIDYSDAKSITTSITLTRRKHSKLSKASLEEFNKEKKIITKGGGGSIYSDAMSQRSKLSRYSRRGKSVDSRKDKLSTLEKISEDEEINTPQKLNQKCDVCETDLTKEETGFNSQIISYKQDKEKLIEELEENENSEKISAIGNNIIESNLKKALDPEDKTSNEQPILCAKCMYDLYISKGIVPQTKNGEKKVRSNSETRGRELTNEEVDRKIQKEIIMAKHLGQQTPGIQRKSNLINAAQTTFAGFNFKPSMKPKQTNLASNFSELTGSTSFIDKKGFNKTKALSEFPKLLTKGKINPEELYTHMNILKPEFPSSTSKEEHGWEPFQNLAVNRHFHRKKNDISEYSHALFSHATSS